MGDIEFAAWTDAQLAVGLKYANPAQAEEIRAEQAKRVGTSDGSFERVDALLAQTKGRKR